MVRGVLSPLILLLARPLSYPPPPDSSVAQESQCGTCALPGSFTGEWFTLNPEHEIRRHHNVSADGGRDGDFSGLTHLIWVKRATPIYLYIYTDLDT